jgi:hypothetical protein
MRQILILKGTRNRETIVVNLPESHTYQVSFKFDEEGGEDGVHGLLSVSHAHKETEIKMVFVDANDAREFENSLREYMMNASMPVMVENNSHEIRYWMEFEVLEVCDAF